MVDPLCDRGIRPLEADPQRRPSAPIPGGLPTGPVAPVLLDPPRVRWLVRRLQPGRAHRRHALFVAFVCGCVLALAGYYYPGFRAGEIDLYRNVVVREGERIERLTNAFSDRPFAVHYDGLPPKDAASAVQDWARTMAKAGLLLGHRTTPEGTVVYLVPWTGLAALRSGTAA